MHNQNFLRFQLTVFSFLIELNLFDGSIGLIRFSLWISNCSSIFVNLLGCTLSLNDQAYHFILHKTFYDT